MSEETSAPTRNVGKMKLAWEKALTIAKEDPKRLYRGGGAFLLAFLFSRAHLAFGAYPFGIGFLAALPRFVPFGLLGGVLGALSLGKAHWIEAALAVFAVLLRLFLSLGDERKRGENAAKIPAFCEPPLLRASVAAVTGFLYGTTVVLSQGLTLPHLLQGAAYMLAAGVSALLFSWALEGENFTLSLEGKETAGVIEKISGIAAAVFLLSLSLKNYSFLGISAALVVSAFSVLLVARKSGAPLALLLGFFGGLPVGTAEAVSLALVGGAAGLFFPLGTFFTYLTSGILLGAWTFFEGGMYSFVDIFPEYALACALGYPVLRVVGDRPVVKETPEDALTTAVGGMVLSYKNGGAGTADKLGRAMSALGPLFDKQKEAEVLTKEDCLRFVKSRLSGSCLACASYPLCDKSKDDGQTEALADKLFRGDAFTAEDFSFCTGEEHTKASLTDAFNRAPTQLAKEKRAEKREPSPGELCALFSRLLSDAKDREQKRTRVDSRASEKLQKYFRERGTGAVAARVLGSGGKAIFVGGYFSDRFTEPYVKSLIEDALGQAVTLPTAHKKEGKTVFACKCEKQYKLQTIVVKKRKSRKEVSGDSFLEFESDDGDYFLCLSDGMGTGKDARATADFATGALRAMLKSCLLPDSSLYLLNAFLRAREEECATTVDLFSLDLYTGNADFYKSGAAASFLKRGDSVFRIKSETMPLGLLSGIDNERVHLKMEEGDTLVLCSDGVCPSPEETPWLQPLLSAEAADMKDYADKIMSEAQRNNPRADDMTVVIARVLAA